jgi:stage V sporulation protein SpoVS
MIVKLKVSADTPVGKLAGSISKNLDEGNTIEATAIGASAVNQACKGIATASGHAGSKGRRLETQIGFGTTQVNVGSTTADRTCQIFRIKYYDN